MGTKKILNKDVSNVVEESLAGYLMAYRKYYKKVGEYNAFTYKGHRKDKVALVIGGGSGHEPLFTGYCGAGLADAVACGNVCASPNPELIMEAAKAVDQGKGVLFVYGNYAGDNLNFDMAEEMCQAEGMKTAHVREWDDFASAPKERITDRRGIAGDVYTIKIAGAACDAGLSLEEVVRITEKARDNTNTIGLATSPGTLPGNDKPTFEIADDEMEFGMGLHGEPGIERTKMMPCSDMVDRMYKELKEEMGLKEGDEIAVLVNGLGSTPLLELNLVFYELHKRIGFHDVPVSQVPNIWVAYEPVWSIGVNGTPASADYAEKMHKVIKACLREIFGDVADEIPVLYGGSVNPGNANELIVQPSIDGLFTGRAAWQADNFDKLIRDAKATYEAK